MILRPWTGTSKPPLGVRPIPGHPLRPTAAWLLNEGSGDQITDAVGGLLGTATGTWSWVAGPAMNFAASTDVLSVPLGISVVGIPWSMGGTVYYNGSSFGDGALLGDGQNWWYLRLQTGGNVKFYQSGSSKISCVLPSAGWFNIAVTYDTATLRLYVNGAQAAVPVTYTTVNGSLAGPTYIGRYPNTTIVNSPISYAWYCTRWFSNDDIASLNAQPYCWLGVPDLAAMWAAIPAAPTGRALFLGPNLWTGGKAMIREANL